MEAYVSVATTISLSRLITKPVLHQVYALMVRYSMVRLVHAQSAVMMLLLPVLHAQATAFRALVFLTVKHVLLLTILMQEAALLVLLIARAALHHQAAVNA